MVYWVTFVYGYSAAVAWDVAMWMWVFAMAIPEFSFVLAVLWTLACLGVRMGWTWVDEQVHPEYYPDLKVEEDK